MKISYQYRIDDKEIYVLDKVFHREEISQFHEAYALAPYYKTMSDSNRTSHIKQFATAPREGTFGYEGIFITVESLLRQLFPKEKFERHVVTCNNIIYGDMVFPHTDYRAPDMSVTAVLFVNKIWKRPWGGETIFFNSLGDSVYAINPVPGRLVFFRGCIEHRVGIPQRDCYESRYTFTMKFRNITATKSKRSKKFEASAPY